MSEMSEMGNTGKKSKKPHKAQTVQGTQETQETQETQGQSQAAEKPGRIVYHLQVSFCGKASCSKCREGKGHGPYWYQYQTHNGHTTRHYVGKHLPPGVQQSTVTPWVAYPIAPAQSGDTPTPLTPLTSIAESAGSYQEQERPATFGRSHQGPLIGRDKEWAALSDMLLGIEKYSTEDAETTETTETMRSIKAAQETLPLDTRRTPQCALLTGEAGIGKTRLAEELGLTAQRHGWLVLWSRVYSQESNVPYRTWIELLRRALQHDMFAQGGSLPVPLRPLVALVPDLNNRAVQQGRQVYRQMQAAMDVQTMQETLTRGDEQERLRIQEAVRILFTMLSQQQPVLIVLDDLQWADAGSCELLGYLARHISGYPIMLLGTCRDNEQVQHPLQAMIAHMKREHTIFSQHIEPLSNEEIGLLVTQTTDPTPLPETMIRNIQAQASGNPFFAEELARSGPLRTLPTTITSTLDHRIGRLSMPCQQMLGNAAVLGNTFDLPVILAVEGANEDEDRLFDLLEEAIQARVLTEENEGLRNQARVTYSFWHPLLASHLYQRNSAARRTRIHQRAALVIQRMYNGREEEVAATIAYHLIESGADAHEILHYATLAGNRAYAVSVFTEAMQHYRVALERITQAPTSQSTTQYRARLAYLLERLAECSMILGKWDEARHYFEQLLTARGKLLTASFPHVGPRFIDSAPDTISDSPPNTIFNSAPSNTESLDAHSAHLYEAQVQALIWGEISRTWRYQGNSTETRRCCKRGEEELREHGITTGPAWAKLRYQDGGLFQLEGRFDEALHATQEALTQFERMTLVLPGTSERGERNSSDKSRPYILHVHSSDIPHDASYLTRIQRTLLGDPADIGRVHRQLGLVMNSLGELSVALTHLNAALALFEQFDQVREIAHVQCDIGYIHLTRGEYDASQHALQRSLKLAERIGDEPLCSVIYSNLAKLATIGDKPHEAEIWYKRAISIASAVQDREYENRWNVDLADVLQKQGKFTEARVCLVKAMRVGWVVRNRSWIGNALVGISDYRLTQARAEQLHQGRRNRFLAQAERDIQRALAIEELDAQVRIRGQFVHAQISLLYGKTNKARHELTMVLEDARRHELAAIEMAARQLLNKMES